MAQVMKLSYFPQIKVVHTSKIFHGQLYVPLVNWLLMIGSVAAAAIANNVSFLPRTLWTSKLNYTLDHNSRKCLRVSLTSISSTHFVHTLTTTQPVFV